ncbi:MAG: hydroxyisourate hydrolase [Betaproteobacteria bacterium]|nr:hydroxyisourate hydrolase [Betaproteobacteria bacterium]
MPGVSIHVVDVSRGVVASGMRVELLRDGALVAAGQVSSKGLLEERALNERFAAAAYEARFHVGAWYRSQGVAFPEVPFLEVVSYRFGISDPEQHYHLPFKCTPWGYSCFRGGA